jgi:hypothetical protein
MGNVAGALDEAFTNYMGRENYNHSYGRLAIDQVGGLQEPV